MSASFLEVRADGGPTEVRATGGGAFRIPFGTAEASEGGRRLTLRLDLGDRGGELEIEVDGLEFREPALAEAGGEGLGKEANESGESESEGEEALPEEEAPRRVWMGSRRERAENPPPVPCRPPLLGGPSSDSDSDSDSDDDDDGNESDEFNSRLYFLPASARSDAALVHTRYSASGQGPLWAMCDRCEKWRKLPAQDPDSLPKEWFCEMNPIRAFSSCVIPQEAEASAPQPQLSPSYASSVHAHQLATPRGRGRGRGTKRKTGARGKGTKGNASSSSSSAAAAAAAAAAQPKRRRRASNRADADAEAYLTPDGRRLARDLVVSKSMRVVSLGTVDPTRSAYHNERYIFPVGFRSVRQYTSANDVRERCNYTSEVIDGGHRPLFRITSDEVPAPPPIVSESPSGAWAALLKRIHKSQRDQGVPASAMAGGASGVFSSSRQSAAVSGPSQFGLSSPVVQRLIERMPGAELCVDYIGRAARNAARKKKARAEGLKEEEAGDGGYDDGEAME